MWMGKEHGNRNRKFYIVGEVQQNVENRNITR